MKHPVVVLEFTEEILNLIILHSHQWVVVRVVVVQEDQAAVEEKVISLMEEI